MRLAAIDSQFEWQQILKLHCSMIRFSMEWFANLKLYCQITYLDSIEFSNISISQFSLNLGLKFIYDAFHMTVTDSHVYHLNGERQAKDQMKAVYFLNGKCNAKYL